MNDDHRSIQTCIEAWNEFHRALMHAATACQDGKFRISVQISGGRVLNNQLSNTIDIKPQQYDVPVVIGTEQKQRSQADIDKWFADWQQDLTAAIKERRAGWLRLTITMNCGIARSATLNPNFDMLAT